MTHQDTPVPPLSAEGRSIIRARRAVVAAFVVLGALLAGPLPANAQTQSANVYTTPLSARQVTYGSVDVDGLNIAYREAGDARSPKLVLLHGFPASSHQYRNLIQVLADRFHVIAPDYQGFGNSDTLSIPAKLTGLSAGT